MPVKYLRTVKNALKALQETVSSVENISFPCRPFKVSVKENEVPTEKNSSRASIFATKASYISN